MGFFKAYDMRGTFGVDFNLDTVHEVGKALPKVVSGERWLVGRDCRETSEAIREALVRGLSEAGAEVTDIGLCSTPMVYFHTAQGDFDGSVMITASHNPPSDNGLKVSKRGALPVGYADGLNEVERIVARASSPLCKETVARASSPLRNETVAGASSPLCEKTDSLKSYLDWVLARNPLLGEINAKLKIAVDCSNGMASLFARDIFPNAVLLNDFMDGTFPAHSPNPLKADAREQISKCVRENGLDCGVIFDGDADRCMFVDERGEFVQPDYLIPIVARACAKFAPDAGKYSRTVVHDVRTSRGAIETLREDGFSTTMVPVGHAFAKPVMRKEQALCGGELAGHYYFGEFFGCDSGLLAALRVLSEIASFDGSFSQMMNPIVSRYRNSGEMNFKVEDKEAAIGRIIAKASTFGKETGRSEIDGIRLEFADGWVNVRKSNTEPYLRLVIERAGDLDEWKNALSACI